MDPRDTLAAGGYERVGALFDERGRLICPGTIEDSEATLLWRLAQRPLGRRAEVVDVPHRKPPHGGVDLLRVVTALAALALAWAIAWAQ